MSSDKKTIIASVCVIIVLVFLYIFGGFWQLLDFSVCIIPLYLIYSAGKIEAAIIIVVPILICLCTSSWDYIIIFIVSLTIICYLVKIVLNKGLIVLSIIILIALLSLAIGSWLFSGTPFWRMAGKYAIQQIKSNHEISEYELSLPAEGQDDDVIKINFDFNGMLSTKKQVLQVKSGEVYQFSTSNKIWMLVDPKINLKIAGIKIEDFLADFININENGWEVEPKKIVNISTPQGLYSLPNDDEILTISADGIMTIKLHIPKLENVNNVPGLSFASVALNNKGGYIKAPLIINITKIATTNTDNMATPKKEAKKQSDILNHLLNPVDWLLPNETKKVALPEVKSSTDDITAKTKDVLSELWKTVKQMTK